MAGFAPLTGKRLESEERRRKPQSSWLRGRSNGVFDVLESASRAAPPRALGKAANLSGGSASEMFGAGAAGKSACACHESAPSSSPCAACSKGNAAAVQKNAFDDGSPVMAREQAAGAAAAAAAAASSPALTMAREQAAGAAASAAAATAGPSPEDIARIKAREQAAGAAASAAAAAAGPGCPPAQRAGKATACIQPVVIANDDGSSPTSAPSFAAVQSIWKKCCIDYSVSSPKIVKKTSFRTLDESPTDTPTAEENALFAAAGTSSCVQVFVPVDFAMNGTTGKSVNGGGATYSGGTAHPRVVVVEGAASEVVAHEVGHASGAPHDLNPTVMQPTGAYNVPNSPNVSPTVCTNARTGAVLKVDPNPGCCETTP